MRVAEGGGSMGGLNSSLNINQRKQEDRRREKDFLVTIQEDERWRRKGDGEEEEEEEVTRQLVRQSWWCVICVAVCRALLRGCLISSLANQTPYTQNSIRSLHKLTSPLVYIMYRRPRRGYRERCPGTMDEGRLTRWIIKQIIILHQSFEIKL